MSRLINSTCFSRELKSSDHARKKLEFHILTCFFSYLTTGNWITFIIVFTIIFQCM